MPSDNITYLMCTAVAIYFHMENGHANNACALIEAPNHMRIFIKHLQENL